MEVQSGADTGGGPCIVALNSPYSNPLSYVTSPSVNCNAGLSNVPNTARVIGVEHNKENPGYGVGLMTAVASACAGLYFADPMNACSLSTDEKKVALGLLQHGQLRTPQDATFCDFRTDCLDFVTLSSAPCSDSDYLTTSDGGYKPKDFPIALFYSKRGITGALGSPYYQFDQYCENRTTTAESDFWGANRKAFYQILSYQIFEDPPAAYSISAACASTTGGLGLTVSGAGFLGDLYLYLAGTEVLSQSVSGSMVSLTTPSRSPSTHATGDVLVVNPGPRKAVLTGAFSWALRGDANNSGAIEASDMFRINAYLNDPVNHPLPILCSGDANSSSSIEASDMFYLNAYLLGGSPPGP